jgi:alkanesulfonate monooxygenase SsuD/methylene tetrahydromethanopterin reductase-like flavin-dependent oxidoreductase (luciferase family)
MTVSVGAFLPAFEAGSRTERQATVAGLDAAGLDHLAVGDHVSFRGGQGFDGLVQAAHLLTLSERLPVHVGVYLLALRHPVVVARQLADLAMLAPDRLVLGVGVGGEDRHEFESCGIDPATRGRRTDEALPLLRRLLRGEPVSSDGPFYPLQDARVLPAAGRLPIVTGGRSDAAVTRTARHGDGWLGIWVSPRRFAEVTEQVAERAHAAGRTGVDWRHGLQVWCGFGADAERAAPPLARAMEQMYATPFTAFARYSPVGTPEDVAAALEPYVEAGCRSFNLIPRADDRELALAGVAEVARLLRR